jgi:DNA repair exonuclease SbcCD ATPase subunit
VITRVRLLNWKAYESFDIEVTPGTTFLVARNGIGKSSFVEAVRWVLDPNAKPARGLMRRLSASTTVTVDLRVNGTDVTITRSLSQGRATTPTMEGSATIGSDEKPILDALDWIAAEWRADAHFLHRSAFLTDQLLLESGEPDLEGHLVRLYSLDELREAKSTAAAAASQLDSQARAAKKQVRASAAELADAEANADEQDGLAQQATEGADAAEQTARHAVEEVTAAERQVLAQQRLDEWQTTRTALLADIENLLGATPPDADLDQLLQTAEAGARAQQLRDAERRAALNERIASVDASLERLHTAAAECPVCRRPLDDASRDHAEHAHQADKNSARTELAALAPAEEEDAASDISRLRRRVVELGQPPEQPAAPPADIDALRAAAAAASAKAKSAKTDAEQARAKAFVARERANELVASAHDPDPVRLYEQAGLLEASVQALNRTIDEVLTRQISPLRDQVNRRWEGLFPDRPGLQLDHKGHLARTYDDDGDPLPFESFSSGEKIIAKILMRLTTIAATTDIPFIWIDEPLEHLDPVSRIYVAETLALLTAPDGIAQIVITTYEDELARRLEAQADHTVQLRMLRSAPAPN